MKPTNHSYAGGAMPVASCHSFLFRLLQPINLSSIKAALGLYKDCWVLFMLPRLPVKSGTNILREKAPWTMDSIDLGENGLAEHTIYLQLKGDKTSPLDLNARHMQSNLHQLLFPFKGHPMQLSCLG